MTLRWLARCVACAVLAGCGSGTSELGLTLTFDDSISASHLAQIARLAFVVSGDETGEYDLSLSRALGRSERVVYRPRPTSRAIALTIDAYDAADELLGHGTTTAIAVGPGLHRAEITLFGGDVVDDAGSTPDGRALDGGSTPGLVAYWKFDEGSGSTTADSSGHGHTGSFTGTGGPTWGQGVEGYALSFSASNSVQVADAPDLSGMATVTLTAWIQLGQLGQDQDFLSKRDNDVPYYSYDFQIETSNQFQFEVNSESGDSGSAGSTTALESGVWYHVVGVYDGAMVSVYLDGAQVGYTNALNGAVATTAKPLAIGFQSFVGEIDELRIYDRALSPAEILALYEHP